MTNQQLIDFIKLELQKGASKEIITKELLANGWTTQDVEEGFNAIKISIPIPNSLNIPVSPSFNNINLSNNSVSNFASPVDPSSFAQNISNINIQSEIKYAGFWVRLGAYLIDGLVLIVPILAMIVLSAFLIGIPKEVTSESMKPITNIASAINLLVTWIYFVFMTYKYQGTLGKKAFGVKVYSEKLERLSFGKIILRETVGKIVSGMIFLIGYLMVAFTQKKQGLHDKIASSVVVYNDPNKKTSNWAIILIVFFFIGIPFILGIGSAVVLSALENARDKQNIKIKETLSAIIPEAISYAEKNSSYLGFKPEVIPVNCNSDPVVNISSDGKQIAVFMKSSCADNSDYFCVNPVTNFKEEMANSDDVYVKGGATVCYSEKGQESENISDLKTDEKITSLATGDAQVLLTKIFKDDVLGYEIKYPEGWTYEKQEDKKTGASSVTFSSNIKNSTAKVILSKMELDSSRIPVFVEFLQKKILDMKGKYSETKDFIYKFEDKTTLIGKQFESEYTYNTVKSKQRDIFIGSGKNLFWMNSISNESEYDEQIKIADLMLTSWVIKK